MFCVSSLSPILQVITLPSAQAVDYPPTGYCDLYVAPVDVGGFNYDHTQVPNYKLSEYIDHLSTLDAMIEMNEIKLDQLCIQKADLEKKLENITDESIRTQTQDELASLLTSEERTRNSLRDAQERIERLARLLEILRALARDGNEEVSKTLIDLRAGTLEDFHDAWEGSNDQIDADFDAIIGTIEDAIGEYADLTSSAKIDYKETLEETVTDTYTPLKSSLNTLKSSYVSDITIVLKDKLDSEQSTFESALRDEIEDTEELSKALQAYAQLRSEKEARYLALIQGILTSSLANATEIEGAIESVLGPIDTAFLFPEPVARTETYAFSQELQDMIRTSEDRVLPSIKEAAENHAAMKQVMLQLNTLMHSADFQLLSILKDPNLTQRAIQAVEDDDTDGLKDIVEGITEDQRDQINQQYQDHIDDNSDLLNQYDDLQNQDELTDPDDNLTPDQIEEGTLNKCKTHPELTEDACSAIAYVASIYGGYGDYLISQFLKSYPPGGVRLFKQRADSGLKLLKTSFTKNSSLREEEQNLYKFKFLTSLFLSRYSRLIDYTQSAGYFLKISFNSEIDSAGRRMENFLAFLQEYSGTNSSCDPIFDKAVKDLIISRTIPCSGSSNFLIATINAFRKATGMPLLDISSSTIANNEYQEAVQVEGYKYFHNTQKNYIIRQNTATGKTHSIVYFDDNARPIVRLDDVFATFYTYDSKGQLTDKVKSDVENVVWNQAQGIFKEPSSAFRSSKTDWYYNGDGQVSTRRDYTNTDQPEKIFAYHYLSEDVANRSDFTGNKRKFLDHVAEQRVKLGNIDGLLDTLVSRVSVYGGTLTRHDFYYDDLFILEFIHEERGGKQRNIFLSHVDKTTVESKYNGIQRTNTLDISSYKGRGLFDQINPIMFMDGNGQVVSNINHIAKKTPFILARNNEVAYAGFNYSLSTNGCSSPYMSCATSTSVSSVYYPYYNYYNVYFPPQIKEADQQCTESETSTSLTNVQDQPVEEQANTLLSHMFSITGTALGEFIDGAGEEIILYGIASAAGIGVASVLGIAKIVAKKAGLKGLLKVCAKFIPYAGWGMAAYSVYEAINYYPDRIGHCATGEYRECGRLTVNLVGSFVGLAMVFKGVNMRNLSKSAKEGLERVVGSFTRSKSKAKQEMFDRVVAKTGKTKNEVLSKFDNMPDDEVELLFNNEVPFTNVANGLTKGGNPIKYKVTNINSQIKNVDNGIRITTQKTSLAETMFLNDGEEMVVERVFRNGNGDPKFFTAHMVSDQVHFLKIDPKKIKTFKLDKVINEEMLDFINLNGKDSFLTGDTAIEKLTNRILNNLGREVKSFEVSDLIDNSVDKIHRNIIINLK